MFHHDRRAQLPLCRPVPVRGASALLLFWKTEGENHRHANTASSAPFVHYGSWFPTGRAQHSAVFLLPTARNSLLSRHRGFFKKTGQAAQSCLDSFPTIRVCCEVRRRAVRALHCLTSFRSGPHTDKQEPLQSPTQVKRNGYSHSRLHGVTSLRGVTFDGPTSASRDDEAAAAPDISSAAPRSIFSRLSNAGPPRQLCGAHAHTPGCGH